jgi:hypothetical protein
MCMLYVMVSVVDVHDLACMHVHETWMRSCMHVHVFNGWWVSSIK